MTNRAWWFHVTRDSETYNWIETACSDSGTVEYAEQRAFELIQGGADHVGVWVEDVNPLGAYSIDHWQRYTSISALGD